METTKSTIEADRLAATAEESARLCGISRAQWWKLHAMGKVPSPIRLGSRAPRWRVDELRAWLAAGCPDRATWQRMNAADSRAMNLNR